MFFCLKALIQIIICISLLVSYADIETEVWSDLFLAFSSYTINAEKVNELQNKHGMFMQNFGISVICSTCSLLAPLSTDPHESPVRYHDVTLLPRWKQRNEGYPCSAFGSYGQAGQQHQDTASGATCSFCTMKLQLEVD